MKKLWGTLLALSMFAGMGVAGASDLNTIPFDRLIVYTVVCVLCIAVFGGLTIREQHWHA